MTVALAAGCGAEAQEDLVRAARSLEEAGDGVRDAAQENLETAKEVADKAGEAYTNQSPTTTPPSPGEPVTDATIRCADETYEVDRSHVEQAIANPMAILRTTSVDLGGDHGARVTRVDPNGLAEQLDVRAGDLIVRIDGVDVAQIDGNELAERIVTAHEVTATIVRDGERITKTVRIVDG
jgi:type II secretory pathway component PulC